MYKNMFGRKNWDIRYTCITRSFVMCVPTAVCFWSC